MVKSLLTRRKDAMTTVALGVVFLLVCDRILKYWALYGLYHTKIDIIAGLLTFEMFQNKAIAFSIPLAQWLVIPIVVVVIVLLAGALVRRLRRGFGALEAGLMLIMGGALSNLYDRLQYGFVIDYLNIVWLPVFNVADLMIGAGVALAVWQIARQE